MQILWEKCKRKKQRFFSNIIDGSFWTLLLLQIPSYYLVGGHFTKSREGHWYFTKLSQIQLESCAKCTEKMTITEKSLASLLEKCAKKYRKNDCF